jgi:Zn-dependent protease with chaperone function
MIITALENFVLFSTVLALVCFACAWAARRAAERDWWRPAPDTLSHLYAAAIVVPPLFAAWLVTAALVPELWLGQAGFEAAHPEPQHNVHLLGELTASLEPALAYGTLAFAASAGLFALWSSVRSYLRAGSVIARLEMQAAPPPTTQLALVERIAVERGLAVGLVVSDYPFSFVWGFGRSKLVLSSGLLHALTPEELTGVLEHEAAHHARRDNLIKLWLTLLGYASLAFPLSWLLLRWRAEEVEMVCDEVAAARTAAPLEIAEALVKLRRQATVVPARVFASSFTPDNAPSFERRVRRVIALADALPSPARANTLTQTRKGWTWILLIAFFASLATVYACAPLAIHQAAESLIQLIA